MKSNTLVLLAGLALAACGGGSAASTTTSTESESQAAATSGSEQQALVPMGQTQVGDRTTCPVSGEEFVVTENSPTAEHDGRTYHFCCPGCGERFLANPHQYLSHDHEAAEAGAES
jgi:xanthine dehydrogenase accessory factor